MALAIPRAALVGGLALTLSLSACSGEQAPARSAPSGPASTGAVSAQRISPEHNQADTRFALQMIPHHRQAVEMAELVPDRTGSAAVKALAEQIKAAQQPEIERMTAMLGTWGVRTSGGSMASMKSMQGMMSPQQMTALENASGAQFDRMFLQMMITHHEGAVQMARTEQARGNNPQAIELARQIEATQLQEIQRMRDLLAS